MEFFITENQRKQTGGTCYFEFQKGQKRKKYKSVFWREDSLLLDEDILEEAELYKIIPGFDYFGTTIIDKETWVMIQHNVEKEGGIAKNIIDELGAWVEENFKEFDYFVILGM